MPKLICDAWIYRKASVIREFMNQCKAWFDLLKFTWPVTLEFISWKPQDFPETLSTRRESWIFPFICVTRKFFWHSCMERDQEPPPPPPFSFFYYPFNTCPRSPVNFNHSPTSSVPTELWGDDCYLDYKYKRVIIFQAFGLVEVFPNFR